MIEIVRQMAEDLYQILNLPRSATTEEIKKAYRRKAMEYHPDKTNGDKAKEEMFKKINDAYSVLGDPKKKKKYDDFGIIDNGVDDGGGGMPPEMAEMFASMFGGMGMGGPNIPGMPAGFQFMFNAPEQGASAEDVFSTMFGGFGGGGGPRSSRRPTDAIDVDVDIRDIYYGKSKKVEFELLDRCSKCQGTGASDPSAVIRCITCRGQGRIQQAMGPFMQISQCHSCGGQGTTIKAGKHCGQCRGGKTAFTKRAFELMLPKGIPNGYEVRMDKSGSYDDQLKGNRDIVFRFRHKILPPYSMDDQGNVTVEVPVPIEDLLSGFTKKVKVYDEEFTLQSQHYFNPTKRVTVEGMGITHAKKNKAADLHFAFKVEYGDAPKLVKHVDIMRKVLKKSDEPPAGTGTEEGNARVVNLTPAV